MAAKAEQDPQAGGVVLMASNKQTTLIPVKKASLTGFKVIRGKPGSCVRCGAPTGGSTFTFTRTTEGEKLLVGEGEKLLVLFCSDP
jgi:hypothetical protein